MEAVAQTSTKAPAMVGEEVGCKDSMEVIAGVKTTQPSTSIEQSGAKDTENKIPLDVAGEVTTDASALIENNT